MTTLPPIASLAPSGYQPVATLSPQPVVVQGQPVLRDSWVTYLIAFIVIAIIVYLILWAIRPQWLRNDDGSLNVGKTIGVAVVVAFILVLLWWALRSCSRPY